ncbi:type I polyketide synthase [Actinosynnema pretiosum]|uniref:type I polyketide synthase n=1 Tax=Actinosynnema pretiosum TaxID=42197 RepID=UPI0020A4CA04|nr:type I polyketide synthase [Actinosynnema pretiosum]
MIGLACRFPGADDVEQFWRNLVVGNESISFPTTGQLREAGVPEEELADPDYVAAVPRISDADMFDAGLFAMTEQEARMCDPQIRLFLELCHAALENAGYDPFATTDSVGVYGTTGPNGYLRQSIVNQPDLVADSANVQLFTLNHADYLATLTSHRLDLRGPSMTVLTACSSSLVAVHLAAQALRAGDCDMALAGGSVVEVPLDHGYVRTPGSVHSADGHCRPFDAGATGTVFGSGAGIVAVKRLSDALADGDDIRAVIRSSAINNDGADKVSFTAPSVSGQSAVVVEAMALAGVRPDDVDHVEAHATGTALGDPVEVHALTAGYRALSDKPLRTGRTSIGSVKANIGHMNAAAGIAGLIKTVLMLEREAIVPTINVDRPNPALGIEDSPFTLATRLRPWPRREDGTRTAAVSSLGVGGTNAHVVLTEGPRPPVRRTDDQPGIVPWSAHTGEGVEALRKALVEFFAAHDGAVFADAAATLRHGRTEHPVRAAVVGRPGNVAALLADPARVITGRADQDRAVVFAFPGQGAQRARMAAGLYGTVRAFTIALDECVELFEAEDVPLYDLLLAETLPDDTATTQPLLFAVEYALAEMWREWGVTPAGVLGHSLGEISAAAVAGVFSLPDAVRVVAGRAEAMAAHPVPGGLLAVRAGVEAMADRLPDGISVAAVNSPRQTVLTGPVELLRRLAGALAEEGTSTRVMAVSLAFHHPDWRPAADRFRKVLESVAPRPPCIPLYSGRTGALVTPKQAMDPGFWSDQVVHPVIFGQALDAVLADPRRQVLEVGPGSTLTGLVRQHPVAVPAVASLPSSEADDEEAVLLAAAGLWTNGTPVDWTATGQARPARKVAAPGYPYQRRRYWIDPDRSTRQHLRTESAHAVPTTRADENHTPFTTTEWVCGQRPAGLPGERGTALVLLPSDGDRAVEVVSAVERAGYRSVRVRPGAAYAEARGEFQVRLTEPADLDAVRSRLAARGVDLDLVVHAAALGEPEPSLRDGLRTAFGSLFELARSVARHPVTRFRVITSRSVDVSGDDPVSPARATAHGLVRTLLAEAPLLRGGVIDVGDRVTCADLAAELRLADPPRAVALRGRRRWVPVETPLEVSPSGRDVLRERGVYVITGGFGGLGLVLARHLASTGLRPRLVLMGRSDRTTDDEHVRERVAELCALGADVLTLACDVGDREAVRAAMFRVTAHHGRINGLFHLAGVPGDRMIAFREHEDAAAVLAPKTYGTVNVLEELGDSADFAVLFSSRAAEDGLVGGADYASANAFVDAVAWAAVHRVVSVGWPVWLGAGMVDHDGPDITGLADVVARLSDSPPSERMVVWEGELGAATHWVLDEHRVGRKPLLPGTGYVDLVTTVFQAELGEHDKAVELTDVVFRALLAEERSRPVRVEFVPDGLGYGFTVTSLDGSTQVTHATGRIANTAGAPARVDLAELRERMRVASVGSPQREVDVPFTLGPRWRNVRQTWQAGDERLVRLELISAFAGDLDAHRLHPALLDMGTAAVRDAGEGAFVPFLIRKLTRYADIPMSLHSYVRRLPSNPDTAVGAVDLVADDGTVVVSIEDYTMRRVDFDGDWDRAATAPVTEEPRADVGGLPPEVGVELLMRLLGGDVPANVLVRPYREGRPSPLEAPRHTGPASPAREVPAGPARSPEVPAPVEPARSPTPAPVRDRLRELWMRTLGAPPADGDSDFFEVGGDSLAAVEFMAKVRGAFGIELSIGLLLDLRTFGALLARIEQAAA